MKVLYLIIGANGFLGSYLIKNILEKTEEQIIATARNLKDINCIDKRINWIRLDVSKIDEVNNFTKYLDLNNDEPLKILYLAAYHHPDLVNKNPKIAWNTNITALSYFINSVNNVKCFFYPSTDVVYGDGDKNKRFKESDFLNPSNIYGKQKKVAESIVTTYGYNVLRFPVMIGPSLLKHKKHFYDQIVENITSGNPIKMFKDQYKSMLDFDTTAKITINLIEKYSDKMPKILNVSGDKPVSKYEVGCMIAKKYNVDTSLIEPISIFDTNDIFTVPRAAVTLLDNSLVKKYLGIQEINLKI